MITQSFMADLLLKVQPVQDGIKKSEAPKDNKMEFPQFKEILGSAMERPRTRQPHTDSDIKRSEKNSFENNDRKARFNTYQEAARYAEKTKAEKSSEEVNSSSKPDRTEAADIRENVKSTPKSKQEKVIESLAEVLGINEQDLINLLGALNIKPEELLDSTKSGEIADKLAGILGLDDEQRNTLANIIDTTSKKVNEFFEETKSAESEKKQEVTLSKEKEVKGPEIEVVKDPKAEFQEIMVKFKARLDEIKGRLEKDPQALAKEIVQNLQENMQEEAMPAMNKGDKALQTTEVAEIPIENGENESTVIPKTQQNEDTDSQKDDSQNDNPIGKAAGQTSETLIDGAHEDNAAQFNNMLTAQVNKGNAAAEAGNVRKEVPVTKTEVINQVIEKAKVVITGDKSEMVMDLKPDSLGKLSLKVVTERGMVVAQFVAESQQVKQILESNMQLLKDTLEKQGLAVQEFSVSVGQDSPREFDGGEKAQGKPKQASSRIGSTSGVSASGIFDGQSKVNAYNWSDSSINLTA